ncbi:MAG TPA: hypothetical protein VFS77_18580 [Pyrinomonadaceae bacterium]|nr:hypothetical protein [Pyrinomonadaceae bacterium]
MSTVICNALFGDWSVPPSETRGPVSTSKGSERSDCRCTSSAVTALRETKVPLARTSATETSAMGAVAGSTLAEILKSVFERTSKGTRITPSSPPALDNVNRTALPLWTTLLLMFSRLELGEIERATVSLTVAVNVAEPVCASTRAHTTSITASSVKTKCHLGPNRIDRLAGIT